MSPKDKTLVMIGNAHIDPVWLWCWDEGFQEVKATFRSALDRMNEFPDFVFTASSAAFYEWIEHNDPAMFAEIKQRVAEGRWQPVGGWWVEPDCNIPSGEAFVRQGLYGQRYFRDRLGRMARVGYNPDSFGHNANLPQILVGQGLNSYCFLRPGPHENDLPGPLFWWEAEDGSRVLAWQIVHSYGSWGHDISDHVRACADALAAPLDAGLCFYGVGNHGGGPTIENLKCIEALQADPAFPTLILAGPERLLDADSTRAWVLPVVCGELQHHASGCYAAHSGIKRWNRQAENLLLAAEKWSAVAERVTGQPYPPDFDLAWKNVLFNQFHDTMAGTAIEPAYDDARNELGEALSIARRGLNHAVQSLAWNIHIPAAEGRTPIVVFNPHAWPARVPVELECGGLQPGAQLHGLLVDDAGQPVAGQTIQSAATVNFRSKLSFVADLPGLGYRTYFLASQASFAPAEPSMLPAGVSQPVLENAAFRLEIDPATGSIARLYDKAAEVDVFDGPAARAVVIDDPSDTWSHGVFRFDRECGAFRARSVQIVEQGPVKAVLRVISEYDPGNGAERSLLTQDFTLYAALAQIDVHVTVDWRGHYQALKLRFPARLQHSQATAEVAYGSTQRSANGDEDPVQSWVDLSGVSPDSGALYGLSVLNDGKYSGDITGNDIGLTVLRSPVYANHVPVVPDPAGHYTFQDQGVQRFTYTLLPHEGSWREAETVRRAAELNQRPVALLSTVHPHGALPFSASFASTDRPNVDLTVVKSAEDGNRADLILRAYETAGVATTATISLRLPPGERTFAASFGAHEIKTWRVPHDAAEPVQETNLLEMAE
jgi:alpha-mannosidase